MSSVTGRIRVQTLPGPKGSRRPTGVSLQEILMNRLNEGKQGVTTAELPDVSAPSAWWTDWRSIDWQSVYDRVWRLQVRIAKAVRENRWGGVQALQRIIVRSLDARLLAVRRVTTNKGKRTPGVDGVLWNTPRQKIVAVVSLKRMGYNPVPLRRLYIPKKTGKRRPLGIPAMLDRAMQALYLLALNPIAETLADKNSYGFRLRRSTADALGQCFIVLAKKNSPVWVWEGDIEGCFDNISHEWMLKNIPMDKSILRKWLKAGYLEGKTLYPTEKGTPQGGLVSPALANMALDGLEDVARSSVPKRLVRRSIKPKVNVIRYADDFLISGHSKELLEERVIPAVTVFLRERGLNISEMKSRVTRIRDGFDFLGANIRKYGRGKLLMKPSKENVHGFIRKIREYIRKHPCMTVESMIYQLNPRIRGWANYFRPLISGETFRYVDSEIFIALWRWARRRHGRKRAEWVVRRYFHIRKDSSWVFSTTIRDREGRHRRLNLVKASSLGIRRHVKIRAETNVFDPEHADYLVERRRRQRLARRDDYRRRRRWEQEVPEYAI